MNAIDAGTGLHPDRFYAFHDLLTKRPGWSLPEYESLGADGYPDDPEVIWFYDESFDGIAINEVDIGPSRLYCFLASETKT